MSHFHRPATRVAEQEDALDPPRSPFADVAGRFASWIAGIDRTHEDPADPAHLADPYRNHAHPADPADPLAPAAADDADPLGDLLGDHPAEEEDEPGIGTSRFPLSPLGYNRAAVDEHLAELERQMEELRVQRAPRPMTINEELERIGEQTASILVVAHDKASETTRRAQEQAERCLAEARANARAITEEAERRLREIDGETDAVWRERERLLDDVRCVSGALIQLADEASERFPAAEPPAQPDPTPTDPQATQAFDVADAWHREDTPGV